MRTLLSATGRVTSTGPRGAHPVGSGVTRLFIAREGQITLRGSVLLYYDSPAPFRILPPSE
jgi:hypothetical protein